MTVGNSYTREVRRSCARLCARTVRAFTAMVRRFRALIPSALTIHPHRAMKRDVAATQQQPKIGKDTEIFLCGYLPQQEWGRLGAVWVYS